MNVYTATEVAYKNGYKKGIEDGAAKEYGVAREES